MPCTSLLSYKLHVITSYYTEEMPVKKKKELLLFALFVFPAAAFVLFATDIPFVLNLYYSLFEWNGVGKNMDFVGMQNFVKIFTDDPLFWQSVRFTLKFAVF